MYLAYQLLMRRVNHGSKLTALLPKVLVLVQQHLYCGVLALSPSIQVAAQ